MKELSRLLIATAMVLASLSVVGIVLADAGHAKTLDAVSLGWLEDGAGLASRQQRVHAPGTGHGGPSPNTGPAFQQPPEGECDELQVVFVIDQSGSMSLEIEERLPSDPNGLRFFGPATAAKTFSALRYQTYPSATMRIAMVYFGDKAELAMPWTTLDATTQAEHDTTKQKLAPFFAPVESMGNTNVLAAFQVASSLFDQAPPQTGECPTRAVIVLTDGKPYVHVEGFAWGDHMTELASYVQQYMSPPDHRIYVIGVDEQNTYWDTVGPYWETAAGDPLKVVKAESEDHMASLVIRIAQDLATTLRRTGTKATMECVSEGRLPVPPFVQQLQMTLVKPSLDLHLVVLDESGRQLEPLRNDVSVTVEGYDEPVETLIVNNPPPGVWMVQTKLPVAVGKEDPCQIQMIKFEAVGQLMSPDKTDAAIQFKRLPVVFQVVDTEGDPLPDYGDAQYALDMDVRLVGPSKQEQILTLDLNPGQEYAGETIPLEASTNQLQVEGTSRDPDGKEFTVFDKSISTIQVKPVMLELIDGPSGVLEQYVEVPLKFAIVVTGQQPIQLDLPTAISGTLTHGDVVSPLLFAVDQDGAYKTAFFPDKDGRYTVDCQVTVETPRGRTSVGDYQASYDVFPVERIGARLSRPEQDNLLFKANLIKPAADHFVATDPLLRATGLVLEVQMIDEDGKAISPGDVGAANPMSVFGIKVLDKDSMEIDVDLELVNTGKPGLFRLSSNTLGMAKYQVVVTPSTELGKGYAWAGDRWAQTLHGDINPLFFVVLGAGIIAVGLVTGVALRLRALAVHPLTGYLEVFQEVPDPFDNSMYRKPVFRKQLPRRNRVVLRVPGNIIRQIKVTCPTPADSKAGRAYVEVRFKSGPPKKVTLDSLTPAMSLGSGFFIEKGPKASGLSGPDVGDEF